MIEHVYLMQQQCALLEVVVAGGAQFVEDERQFEQLDREFVLAWGEDKEGEELVPIDEVV